MFKIIGIIFGWFHGVLDVLKCRFIDRIPTRDIPYYLYRKGLMDYKDVLDCEQKFKEGDEKV